MTVEDKFARLNRMNSEALKAGGEKRIEKQHQAGKMTARERVLELLDAVFGRVSLRAGGRGGHQYEQDSCPRAGGTGRSCYLQVETDRSGTDCSGILR